MVTDANLCKIIEYVFIDDLEKPIADFNTFPNHRRFYDQLDDPIVFIDMTECFWQKVLYWEWDFGDGTFGTDSITSHIYSEKGEFDVLLTIITEGNCIDTISYKVLIDEYDLFIPNAFSPGNSDEINKEFKPYGYGIVNYRMNIYNRWGERVFETEDFDVGWDGTHYLNGNDCIAGSYAYYIEVENIYGQIFKYEDQLRLIR
jgi:gliding motility-associated-like protein